MALITTQDIGRSGTNIGRAAASGGGDTFLPGATTFLNVVNNGGGAITLTVVTPGSVAGDIPVGDVAVSIPAGAIRVIGPFPSPVFADPSDGLADVTYSGVTSVSVGVFALKPL